MQLYPIYFDGPVWSDRLVRNLSFIKKRKRYPLNKQVVSSALSFSFLLTIASNTLLHTFILNHWGKAGLVFAIILLFCAFAIAISFSLMETLKFTVVDTKYQVNENREIIQLFLEAQDWEVFECPKDNEVFQIISESSDSDKDKRELIIFIAGVNCILLNSQFTYKPSSLTPMLPNAKKIANRLRDWITIHASGPDVAAAQ